MTVSFITPGRIDLENVLTFGMSAKDSENPIGFFGTGLKFAIATLLRTGHKITMHIGKEESYRLRTEPTQFRGKDFHKVFLDHIPLSFTTDLGKTWEVWMAFRELESNTRDEKGKTIGRAVTPESVCADCGEHTIITVEGHGIDQAFADMSLIFCDSPILASTDKVEVRAGRSDRFFYHGVRVCKLPTSSLFTYNFLAKEDLTEDRTLKYEGYVYGVFAKYLTQINDESILQRVLTAPEGTFEYNLDFDGATPGQSFINVLKEHYGDAFLNKSARKLARTMSLFDEPEIVLDAVQAKMLERAIAFLTIIGFNVQQYPIKVVRLHGAMGQAKEGKIFIDPVAFRMGTKQLAGTLFEEWFHLTEGCHDNTRTMQNFLVDTVMSMGEKIIGEPI